MWVPYLEMPRPPAILRRGAAANLSIFHRHSSQDPRLHGLGRACDPPDSKSYTSSEPLRPGRNPDIDDKTRCHRASRRVARRDSHMVPMVLEHRPDALRDQFHLSATDVPDGVHPEAHVELRQDTPGGFRAGSRIVEWGTRRGVGAPLGNVFQSHGVFANTNSNRASSCRHRQRSAGRG